MALSRVDADGWKSASREQRIEATLDAMIADLASQRQQLLELRRDWKAYRRQSKRGSKVLRFRRETT